MKLQNALQILMILSFTSGCFVDEVPSSKGTLTTDPIEDLGFPLTEEEEQNKIDKMNNCFANIDCVISENDRVIDDFLFKSGKLILRGSFYSKDESNNQWRVNENLEVRSLSKIYNEDLFLSVESDIHRYDNELKPFIKLIDGVNVNLGSPVLPVIVTQGKLGLKELKYNDPGLCNVLAAEKFERQSITPWAQYVPDPNQTGSFSNYIWPKGTGFYPDNDTFAGETLIICGEINILNRTVKIEAKNIIFYNSHIKIMSDRDMPTGLRINAENIGYYGTNLIESNIINRASGQKNASAPTIDLGASGTISLIKTKTSLPGSEHFFRIVMAEHQ